jgi:hypothetical protein
MTSPGLRPSSRDASPGDSAPDHGASCSLCDYGAAMAVITDTDFGRLGKRFWLLDTFKGLDTLSSRRRRHPTLATWTIPTA